MLKSALALFACFQSSHAGLISEEVITKTLVVVDNWATLETHSVFFSHIRDVLGHKIEYAMAQTGPHIVKHYDEYYFDNIIFMSPSTKETEIADGLKVEDIVEFFEHKGHNLMIFGDIDSRRHVRKLANHFGVDFEPYHHELRNSNRQETQTSLSPSNGEVLKSNNVFKPLSDLQTPVFSSSNDTEIAFTGIGSILDRENQFVFPILRAQPNFYSATHYTKNLETENEPNLVSDAQGEQLTVVAGYQSRNNHRATISGSMSICSDEMMLLGTGRFESSDNYKFCKEMLNWVFQQSGVLRANNLRHSKKGERCTETDLSKCPANPENYQLEDNVEFYVEIEQKTEGVWAPYIANDIQLQLIMLEPYYQVTMQRENQNTYSYKFRVPQRLGVFRFVVDYTRYGLSFLDEQSEVSIIQWRHDAYPRYLTRAFPFYVSVMVLIGGFFIFIVAFLFSEIKELKESKIDKPVQGGKGSKKTDKSD